jgi:ADP-heptose:LPS heptosyltransferase
MADTPKNILIIRLGAMGDIILTSGAVRDIRLAYPDATIHFLTGGNLFAKVLKRNPDIDHVIVAPRPKLQRFWQSIPTIKQLRALNIDRVYDLQDNKTRYLRPFLEPIEWVGTGKGASHRVMIDGKAEPRSLHNFANRIKTGGVEPLHVLKPDVSWMADPVDDVLAELNVPERFILLVPGSSMKNPDRRWPHYGELAEKLQNAGYTCVTVPGPEELELCSKLPATMLMRKQEDGGEKPLTYFELAGVACKAHYAIGNDTGPSHIAARCGAPGLGLFGKATFAHHSGFDTVWSVLQTQDLNTLSVDDVFERAMQDLKDLAQA